MAPQHFTAQPFFDPGDEALRFLPECPRLLRNDPGGAPVLGWVAIQHAADVPRGSVNLLNLETRRNRRIDLPGRPGFFAETERPGTLLVGLERRLVYLDLESGAITGTGAGLGDDERVIINDGLAIEDGVLFGTKHLQFNQTIAALYHYHFPTRRLRVVAGEQTCSNGKFFRRDDAGATLIDIDSLPRTITRYRFSPGLEEIRERSLITPPEALPSCPDGLRPTAGGESIVVAFYNPGCVANGCAREIRLSDGAVLTEWTVPGSPRVTCPELVAMDGMVKALFTTAVEGMDAETRGGAPGAGTLYIADTPFRELPAPPPLVPGPGPGRREA